MQYDVLVQHSNGEMSDPGGGAGGARDSEPDQQVSQALAERSRRRGVSVSDQPIRIVLVDDHLMVREGLRVLLRSEPHITVIGEAANEEAGLMLAKRLLPDVVVLDLDLPDGDGSDVLKRLRDELPDVRVLILMMYGEHKGLLPLLEAGARGYLTKEATSLELVEAIRVVAAGDVYVRANDALLATRLVPSAVTRTSRARFNALSGREQEILSLLAVGHSGAEVARQLCISTKTVDTYKHRIQEKLGLGHRTAYVRFAIEAGVLGA